MRIDWSQLCTQLVVDECHVEGGVTVITKTTVERASVGCRGSHPDTVLCPAPRRGTRIWLHGARPWMPVRPAEGP